MSKELAPPPGSRIYFSRVITTAQDNYWYYDYYYDYYDSILQLLLLYISNQRNVAVYVPSKRLK